jgi:hypothetical protein
MNILHALVVTFFSVITCYAETKCITVGDLKFMLASAPVGSPTRMREYLPEGEHLENWVRLVSVQIFPKLRDSEEYLTKLATQVQNRDPATQYRIWRKDHNTPLVLDFMAFSYKNGFVEFLEWNLMKAHYVEGEGLVLNQYAMRIYNPEMDASKTVIAERNKMLDVFAKASFEEEGAPGETSAQATAAGAAYAPTTQAGHAAKEPTGAGERELDARFVGCWKYATGFGVVLFHSALSNGDFERSMYERGEFVFASRGKWYVEGGVFHIEISKRRTRESGEEYLPAHARFDQRIVAVGEDWYEVKEPSALHVIHWLKISDVTDEVTRAQKLPPLQTPASGPSAAASTAEATEARGVPVAPPPSAPDR